jgi:hypothetical protein
MRDVLAGMLPRLERLRDLARDMMELYHLMSDELEDVGKDLSPETPEGPVSQIGRLEDYSRRLSRRLRRARRSLLVLVAIIAAGVGGALVAPFLASRSAGDLWQELRGALFPAAPWLLPWLSGALLVVLCLAVGLFYSRLKGARRKLTEARRARARFEEKLTELEGVQAALTGLAGLTQSGTMLQLLSGAAASGQRLVVRRAAEVRQRYSDLSDEGGEEALARFVGGIVQSQRRLNGFLAEEAARLEKEAQEAEATLKKSRAEKEKVDNELRECQSQAAKKQALEEKSAELEAGAAQVRGEIDLRLLACRLLEETIASMRGKIGPGLTRFAKSVLPRLTSDRYREVKVEESLEIKVFSSEKSDFLSLYELSGGTNEALSLALRLALSQTLVASRMRQAQFVFLDEPFKMMDMKRAVETLRALRELSPDLKQFLVIQPDFSDSERSLLDSLIETSVKDNKLERTCTAQRRESGARAAAAGGSGEAHAGALSPQRDRRA